MALKKKSASRKTAKSPGVLKKKTTRKKSAGKAAAKSKPKKEVVTSGKTSKTKSRPAPSVGSKIAAFEAASTSGSVFRSAETAGRALVLYFYPKDATPGCTIEGRDFSRLLPEFEKADAVVLGVSRDSLDSHRKFKEKECFGFDLLSDPDENLCRLFGVIKEKNLYGRKFMGIERSTFLIGPDGVLRAEWRGVKVPGHAEEVLARVRTLG